MVTIHVTSLVGAFGGIVYFWLAWDRIKLDREFARLARLRRDPQSSFETYSFAALIFIIGCIWFFGGLLSAVEVH